MVIVDTTVWVDYLNGVATPHTDWLDRELPRTRLGLLDLNLCEILQGLATDREAAAVLREMRRLEIFSTGGTELAIAAAAHYRFLRSRGRTVRTLVDCLIATHCLAHGHRLLHCDRDFDAFEEFLGLAVVHP
jgi:hypothetical protein